MIVSSRISKQDFQKKVRDLSCWQ